MSITTFLKKKFGKKGGLSDFLLQRELAKEQFWWHPGGGGPDRILERRSDPPSGPVRGFPPIMRASRRRPGMDIFPPAARTPTTIAGRISRRLSPGDMYGHVVPVDGTGGRFPRALVADRVAVETGGGGGVAAAAGARVATSICRARRRLPGSLHAVAVAPRRAGRDVMPACARERRNGPLPLLLLQPGGQRGCRSRRSRGAAAT